MRKDPRINLKSNSWPKMVVRKWLSKKSSADEFISDQNKYSFQRRKSCSDKDISASISRNSLGSGWLVETESSENLKQLHSRPDPLNLKMFVGSWNVGGRAPHEELNLREWLMSSTSSPADIYVLGFQEIVPLTVGNVFGPDHKGPAATWLSLIGQALNPNTNTPKLRKSYSNATGMATPRTSFSDLLSRDEDHEYGDDSDQLAHQLPIGSKREGDYRLVSSKHMVGIFVCVWVRSRLMRHVTSVKVSCVGTGIMGYMGNKGSVSVSMTLRGSTFCFVCTHLSSGEKEGDEFRRNSDVMEIFRRTRFVQPYRFLGRRIRSPATILEHDKIIWFGDLNYRLVPGYGDTLKLLQKKDWQSLLERDQLRIQQRTGQVLCGWEEGIICFPPTYKYLPNSNRYAVHTTKSGEKRRTPAWCDRILWRGKGIKQILYSREESRFSDHRPVNSLFSIEVDINDDDDDKSDSIAAAGNNNNSICSSSSCSRVQAEELLLLTRSQSCMQTLRF